VRAAARVFVLLGAALLLCQAWGIDTLDWVRNPLGQRVLGAIASIFLVVAVAIAIWEFASAAIERFLTHPHRDGTAVQRSARVRTLLPLLRKALFVFLAVMVVLISLSEIGVDIAPLLAGAGVVGLAIGFGAQKLVQDVITGVFMLVEDALAVGDVVTVAGASGVVEDLSIRSIRLRDLSGNVHTVPFSSVDTVTNMTKGFSYYPLDIGVAYREDPDKVAQACRDIVDDMRQDPTFAFDILEPLDVLGVDQFADSAVIIKARIKTRPSRQWVAGREFNRRMKKRFDELGIEIPFPHRTIYLGEGPSVRVRLDGATAPTTATPSAPSASPDSRQPRQVTPSPADLPDLEE
jgi:small conductance mechanosensitive channel